jgi:hypothetical protein
MYSEPVVTIPPLRALVKIGVMAAITAFVGWDRIASHSRQPPLDGRGLHLHCRHLHHAFFWTHRVAVAYIGVAS